MASVDDKEGKEELGKGGAEPGLELKVLLADRLGGLDRSQPVLTTRETVPAHRWRHPKGLKGRAKKGKSVMAVADER